MSEQELKPQLVKPRGSFFCYAILKKRMVVDVAKFLRGDRKTSEWLILLAFGSLIAMGGLFAGYLGDTRVINPPAQATGVCQSPASIDGYNCSVKSCALDNSGKQVCVSSPAGYVIDVNTLPKRNTNATG